MTTKVQTLLLEAGAEDDWAYATQTKSADTLIIPALEELIITLPMLFRLDADLFESILVAYTKAVYVLGVLDGEVKATMPQFVVAEEEQNA